MKRLDLIVLISGRGSNLQALIDAVNGERLDARILAVVSNRPHAGGLQLAEKAGIPVHVIDETTRSGFETKLNALLAPYQPDLLVLAGFMRVLTPDFVQQHQGRLINIHPSLLPAFPGLYTHRRALESGVNEHGASVHIVTAEVDAGPVLAQVKVPVLKNDTEQTLAQRVLTQEHLIYPMVLQWFAEERITFQGNRAYLDGHPLPKIYSDLTPCAE